MSLIALRNRTNKIARVVMIIAAVGMFAAAFNGLGNNVLNSNSGRASSSKQQPEDVVATVDGAPITLGAFDRQLSALREQYHVGNTLLENDFMHYQVFQQMEGQYLMPRIAKARGITVSDADIQKEKSGVIDMYKNKLGLPASASDNDVETELNKYNQSISTIAPPDLLRDQAYNDAYQQSLAASHRFTDADVKNYYMSMHTRHILIDNKTRPDAQAQQLAQTIIGKLKGGADFATLAKQYSDDPGTKSKGGDDGFINGETGYVPEFMKAAHALAVGAYTQQPVPVPQFGYFIIQKLAETEKLPADYAKNPQQTQQELAQTAIRQDEQSDLDAARKAAVVVYKDPELRADNTEISLMMSPTSDPSARPKALASALADYQLALKDPVIYSKAALEAQIASIENQLGQYDQAIQYYVQANKDNGTDDPQILMQIGDAYLKLKKTADAVTAYEKASSLSPTDRGIHTTLQSDYKNMKRNDLVATETAWLATYDKAHPQPKSPGAASMRTVSAH